MAKMSLAEAIARVCKAQNGSGKSLSRASLYRWYHAYQNTGFDGLFDQARKAQDSSLPPDFLNFLRKEKEARRPTESILYQTLAGHLATFIDERERELCPLPKYVRDELEAYLRCGIHHYGFLRVRCPKGECGLEHAVPFSGKKELFVRAALPNALLK